MTVQAVEFVDSHAHLDMEDFDGDREEVVLRAFAAGIKSILCPAEVTVAKSVQTTLALIEKFPSLVSAAGTHPHQARLFHPDCARRIEELALAKKIKAVGEIGLDHHYDFSTRHDQMRAFRAQLLLAQALGLPVIIHSRNAGAEVISAIEEERFTKGGVLHCFTEDWDVARKMIELGFFISFSGILTFPKAQSLREVAKKISLDRLLVETDSPFLAPVPFRGNKKRNEPAFVRETAGVLADIKNVPLDRLARETCSNFYSLFV
jgi:TatD DNase family protein